MNHDYINNILYIILKYLYNKGIVIPGFNDVYIDKFYLLDKKS